MLAICAPLGLCATAHAEPPHVLGGATQAVGAVAGSTTQPVQAPGAPAVPMPQQAVSDVAHAPSAVGAQVVATVHAVAAAPSRGNTSDVARDGDVGRTRGAVPSVSRRISPAHRPAMPSAEIPPTAAAPTPAATPSAVRGDVVHVARAANLPTPTASPAAGPGVPHGAEPARGASHLPTAPTVLTAPADAGEAARLIAKVSSGVTYTLDSLGATIPLIAPAGEALTPLLGEGSSLTQSVLGLATLGLATVATTVAPSASASPSPIGAPPVSVPSDIAPPLDTARPLAASAAYRSADPAAIAHTASPPVAPASPGGTRFDAAAASTAAGQSTTSLPGPVAPGAARGTTPVPGGASSAIGGAAVGGISTSLILTGLLLLAVPWTTRRLRLASKPLRPAPFVLLPERPG